MNGAATSITVHRRRTGPPSVKLFGPIDLAVLVIGIVLGFYHKKKHPAKYEHIGRLVNEDL